MRAGAIELGGTDVGVHDAIVRDGTGRDRERADRSDIDVVLITAFEIMQGAIDAMKQGAYDYLIKPFELEELGLRVQKLQRERELGESVRVLESENRILRKDTERPTRLGNMIGKSPVMGDVFELQRMGQRARRHQQQI